MKKTVLLIFSGFFMLTSVVFAQETVKKHRIPSQAAIHACQDKSEGDACEMTTSKEVRSGSCKYTSDKKYLYCKHQHIKKRPAKQ